MRALYIGIPNIMYQNTQAKLYKFYRKFLSIWIIVFFTYVHINIINIIQLVTHPLHIVFIRVHQIVVRFKPGFIERV